MRGKYVIATKCPLMAKSGRIAAQCYRDLPVKVSVFDKSGRRFDNISTLNMGWQVSNDKIGSIIRRQEALDFIEFVLKYPNLDS